MSAFSVPTPPMPPIPWSLFTALETERGGGYGVRTSYPEAQQFVSAGMKEPTNTKLPVDTDQQSESTISSSDSLVESSPPQAAQAQALQAAEPTFPEQLAKPPRYEVVPKSNGSESSCSSDREDSKGPIVLYDRNNKNKSQPSNKPDDDDDDDDAAKAVNKAWISMFVQSELRRAEKRKNAEREQKLLDRQPVVSQQETKRKASIVLYSEETVDKLTVLESRLHAAYETKTSSKIPFWPCTPLNIITSKAPTGDIKRLKT